MQTFEFHRSRTFSSVTEYLRHVAEHDLQHLRKRPNSIDNAMIFKASIFIAAFSRRLPGILSPPSMIMKHSSYSATTYDLGTFLSIWLKTLRSLHYSTGNGLTLRHIKCCIHHRAGGWLRNPSTEITEPSYLTPNTGPASRNLSTS